MSARPQIGVALDFETSAYAGACACAIGMTRLENGVPADSFYSLIRPPSKTVHFTHVHGLRWQDLKDAPTFAVLWPDMSAFFAEADFFVAHNARFDMNVLAACCQACQLPMPGRPFLCTLRGARRGLKLKSYSLASVSAFLGIELRHHHAGSDALACARIYSELRGLGVSDAAMALPPPGQKPGMRQAGRKQP